MPRPPRNQTKVTAYFTAKSMVALGQAAQIGETTRTDAINRAVQLYAFVIQEQADGTEILFKSRDGTVRGLLSLVGGL